MTTVRAKGPELCPNHAERLSKAPTLVQNTLLHFGRRLFHGNPDLSHFSNDRLDVTTILWFKAMIFPRDSETIRKSFPSHLSSIIRGGMQSPLRADMERIRVFEKA
jgi:hypothetical protein